MYSIFFFLSLFLSFSTAHVNRRQEEQCSCPGDTPQFAPIPQQAVGVNVSFGLAEYETEHLGQGAYGKEYTNLISLFSCLCTNPHDKSKSPVAEAYTDSSGVQW